MVPSSHFYCYVLDSSRFSAGGIPGGIEKGFIQGTLAKDLAVMRASSSDKKASGPILSPITVPLTDFGETKCAAPTGKYV